jgi:hypothetical protein
MPPLPLVVVRWGRVQATALAQQQKGWRAVVVKGRAPRLLCVPAMQATKWGRAMSLVPGLRQTLRGRGDSCLQGGCGVGWGGVGWGGMQPKGWCRARLVSEGRGSGASRDPMCAGLTTHLQLSTAQPLGACLCLLGRGGAATRLGGAVQYLHTQAP